MTAPSVDGISVVVPVYNSEPILPELVRRLGAVLAGLGRPYELVLVNDGSRDRSWEVARDQAAKHSWVRAFCLTRNFGQHNALLCGIRAASFGTIVTMDDDLQNPPEAIGELLQALDAGADVVYGTPRAERHGLWRDLASQITKLALQNAMGVEAARNVSAFRAFRASLRDGFAQYRAPFVSIDVLLTWSTTRFAAVKVAHEPRALGESNYTFLKLVTHALNMMTGFTVAPLQFASWIGFLFALFGLGVLAYVVGRYMLQGSPVQGFPFLASIIAIFSGAQLFALGIIGEYLARMHFRTMEKPQYVVGLQAK